MIHARITDRGAGFVRAWIFSIWIVYLLGNMTAQFAQLPREQFVRRGVLALIPERFYDVLLTPVGLHTLKWVLMAGLVACALGVRPWRAVALPTVLLLTLHQGLQRGYFYALHKEMAALYATYILAAFPATGFSWFASGRTKRSEGDEATTRLMMLMLLAVVLVPYSLLGIRRLAHNDFTFWSQDLIPYFVAAHAHGTTWYGLESVAESVLDNTFLLRVFEIGFPIVTVAEVLAPLVIVYSRFRRGWLLLMVGFHISTLPLMDIFFWETLLLYPVLLVDGDFLLDRFDRLRDRVMPAESDSASRFDCTTSASQTDSPATVG